jgi:feS assembly protein sufB
MTQDSYKPQGSDPKQTSDNVINNVTEGEYKYGFTTDIDTDIIPKGLNEDTIRFISAKKNEPEWLLEFRLKAYRHWLTLTPPKWAHLDIPEIDFQAISYYAAPKTKEGPKSLDDVDPELIDTFNKLGISLEEQKKLSGVAVDAVMDSVSVKTTHRDKLAELGVIFCSISEAVKDYPDLVKKYLGKVVPYTDNFYAALNSAVFSDGSFVYIPKGVRCPMELSTYFRINAAGTGQFERTLIVADDDAYVSYLEGCTAPMRDENQLHAAIVEIIVEDRAEVKYSTVQNWYAGDKQGRGGVYNFVTKRGLCRGDYSKLSWTQVETGSAITWKYPGCILAGEGATGEFYSVAVTNNYQQADTGTKMIHLGRNTKSTIVSKGISAGHSQNSYRGLVKVAAKADGCRNYTQCDSLLLSSTCGAHTYPYIDVLNDTAVVEHEATTSKISEDQIFYCNQRGISTEEAVGLIVNGYAKEVMNKLPMEFAVEAQKLLQITLEGSVG